MYPPQNGNSAFDVVDGSARLATHGSPARVGTATPSGVGRYCGAAYQRRRPPRRSGSPVCETDPILRCMWWAWLMNALADGALLDVRRVDFALESPRRGRRHNGRIRR